MSLYEYLCAMPEQMKLDLIGCIVLLFSAKMALKAYLEGRRNEWQNTK